MSDRDRLDKLLADLDPIDEDQVERSFSSLNANPFIWELLKDAPQSGPSAPPSGRRLVRRWAPAVVGGIAAVLLVLGATIGPLGGSDDGSDFVSLNAVAGIASASQSAPPARYDYLAQRSLQPLTTALGAETWVVTREVERQTWVAADGSGRVRQSLSKAKFLNSASRAAWKRAGSPEFLPGGFGQQQSDENVAPGTLTDTPISAGLPRDPVALAEVLRDRAAALGNQAPVEARILALIGTLLASPASSPDLRAALYRVAAGLEGLRQYGLATDSQGREGQEAGLEAEYLGAKARFSIIYDPESAQILSYRTTFLSSPEGFEVDPPALFESVDYLRSARTDTLETPDG